MKIIINDRTIEIIEASSLQEVLDAQNINQRGIATAVNGIVVPLTMRAKTILKEGDNIVIIKAFYGG